MNYLINVDWLKFGASTSINLNLYNSYGIYKITDVLNLEECQDKGYTQINFSHCFKIKYKKTQIGFFYSKALDLNDYPGLNTMIWLDNHTFYRQDFNLILHLLFDSLKLTKTIIKQLDVCVDTDEDILTRFKTYYENPNIHFRNRNKIVVKGTGKSDYESQVGSFTSKTKYLKIYNKTREINTSSNKEYIRHIHYKHFGVKNIYRIELRLNYKLSDRKNIEVINLGQSEYLETIFNTYLDTLIHFEDVRSSKKLEYISIKDNGIKIKKEKRQKLNFGSKREKAIINFLYNEYKSDEFNGERKALKSVISVLIKKYGLEIWNNTRKR